MVEELERSLGSNIRNKSGHRKLFQVVDSVSYTTESCIILCLGHKIWYV